MVYRHPKGLCEQFVESVVKLKRMIERSSGLSAEEGPATMLQFRALKCIKEEPSLATGELAAALNISLSSAAQLVDRLHKLDWVIRESDREDRRISRLRLSKKGEQALTGIQEVIFSRVTKFLSYMPARDIKEVVRICEDAITQFEKAQDGL
jgi:DNA-binding MarR family transcriptional regulator